jgi:O-antigen/teichoic acid export membrane protein
MAAGWGVTAFSGWLLFYGHFYLEVTYRTRGDFARLALVNVLNSMAALALLAVVWLWKYYGLCLRALAAGLVQLALLWFWRPLRVRPKWNVRNMLHLLRIGAPLLGVGQLFAWWGALDSTLVLHFEGVKGLGLYALALMAGSSLNLLPEAMTQVVYPQMAEGHGSGERLLQLLRRAARPTMLLLACVIPLAALGWLAAPSLVVWIAPKYVDVIPAARWALLVPVVACFSPALQVFNVVKRQVPYAAAMVMGMGAYVASLLWLRGHGGGLSSFPQAMAIGRLVFVSVGLTILLQLARAETVAAAQE